MFLTVEDLGKRIGTRTLFEGLCFSLDAGETMAILGPSGSGKSTLLGILAGFIDDYSGRVVFDPRDPSIEWAVQSSPVLHRRSALANVTLPALIKGIDRDTARGEGQRTLEMLGLGDFWNVPVYQLSGGERQRVAIARAVVSSPQLLLADEPTSSLDPVSRSQVLDALSSCAAAGSAVAVATHDPAVAARCDRQLVLDLCRRV